MTRFAFLLAGKRDSREEALRQRASALAAALDVGQLSTGSDNGREYERFLDSLLESGDDDLCWLSLAVLGAKFPPAGAVRKLSRAIYLCIPPSSALVAALDESGCLDPDVWRHVEVSSQVLVDVDHTARFGFSTGIQRVVRETVRRWVVTRPVTLVAWTYQFDALRRLDGLEAKRAVGQLEPTHLTGGRCDEGPCDVIVPWHARIVVPELFAERARADAARGVFEFSRSHVGLVGHDCTPITMFETVDEKMSIGFTHMLAAAKHADRIAAVSAASADEYRGWRTMLGSAGVTGPEVSAVPLAVEASESDATAIRYARAELGIGDLPIALVVGGFNRRKNHLVVLQAAEILWRQGIRFVLAFVGSNFWNAESFSRRVKELERKGRPITVVEGASEALLWASYRIATLTLFVSIHEGYGLPIAESLACGTPVVASNYGAMAELAQMGGVLQVDPRDPNAVAAAVQSILADPSVRSALSDEAFSRPSRSWDDYAEELWSYVVDGVPPGH